jgi:hypothetical protein
MQHDLLSRLIDSIRYGIIHGLFGPEHIPDTYYRRTLAPLEESIFEAAHDAAQIIVYGRKK